MGAAVLGVAASLALTIGVLVVGLHFLRRWMHGSVTSRHVIPLALIQRIATGPRQGIGLLRVGDRVLVVSLSDQGSRLLAELAGQHLQQALKESPTKGRHGGLPERKSPGLSTWLPLAAALWLTPVICHAQATPTSPPTSAIVAPQFQIQLGSGQDSLEFSGAVGIVVLMGVLTLLPTLVLLMTSFTRILVVLHFLRMALGTQSTPPSQLLIAMAVMLSGVVMAPTVREANTVALQPYLGGQISQADAYRAALTPFREFMLRNTREENLTVFTELSQTDSLATIDDIPTTVVASAFITSELQAAFQIGFVIFLPFIVIDLIVASVLVSMGMFMLRPVMISIPFKLLLFVLADGWTLVIQNLAASFRG